MDTAKLLAMQGLVSSPAYNVLNGLPPNMPADAYGNPDWEALNSMQQHRGDAYRQTYNPVTRIGFKRGTSNVAGKKYAKGTDNVQAVLTPREAVLNRNAAELLGRDAIARLNAHGNMLAKRGVDLASLPSDPTPGPSTENMLGYQMGTANVGRDDRADLLRDAENTFYGGGQAPMPTPTPTPKPQGYQYGSEDVLRRRNAASRVNFPQGQIIQGSGAGSGGYGYTQGTGSLPPDQNPAYQAALRNNPTPASRYAQRGQAAMVGTYKSDFGPRAVVSTGANSFRTYSPEGGYIGRTGNAADYLNKQFSANPSNPVQPAQTAVAPVNPPVQSVASTPTSLTVNTSGFQPQGLEANPFAGAPTELTLQPRRYSDLY